MVIAFDTVAEVRQQFTSDKAALRRAIESITAIEGPTRIEEAMRLAKAHKPRRILEDRTTGQAVAVEGLYSGEPVTLHIFSDGRLPDAGISKPAPDDRVEFRRVGGTASGNAAITGIRSERNYEDPSKLAVFVAIANADPQARTLDVELTIDGAVAGIKSATIPGSTVVGVSFRAARRRGPRAMSVQRPRRRGLRFRKMMRRRLAPSRAPGAWSSSLNAAAARRCACGCEARPRAIRSRVMCSRWMIRRGWSCLPRGGLRLRLCRLRAIFF
jgi:hypothetical protein